MTYFYFTLKALQDLLGSYWFYDLELCHLTTFNGIFPY